MILAVVVMLAGEVLFWGSAILGFYLVVFVLVNQVYFILSEEPGLDRRFGEPYRTYKTHVPRWIPRAKPWPGK
jgi:protein-S-isoprenylcysteine O-methyltransferase Ste14